MCGICLTGGGAIKAGLAAVGVGDLRRLTGGGAAANGGGVGGPGSIMSSEVFGCLLADFLAMEGGDCSLALMVLCS